MEHERAIERCHLKEGRHLFLVTSKYEDEIARAVLAFLDESVHTLLQSTGKYEDEVARAVPASLDKSVHTLLQSGVLHIAVKRHQTQSNPSHRDRMHPLRNQMLSKCSHAHLAGRVGGSFVAERVRLVDEKNAPRGALASLFASRG